MSLDDRLEHYQDENIKNVNKQMASKTPDWAGTYEEEKKNLKQAILSDILEIIEDVPLDQPFDEDMDNITLQGHLIFRKAVNWQNERLREKVKKYCE